MLLGELESNIPEITKLLSKTILTSDVIQKICEKITFDALIEVCTAWVNDVDTTIGMECLWEDFLIKEIPLTSACIKEALSIMVPLEEEYVELEVEHEKYGKQDVYITVLDSNIIISTKYRILYDYCTGNTSQW